MIKGNSPYCHLEWTLDDQAALVQVLVEAEGCCHLPEEKENKSETITISTKISSGSRNLAMHLRVKRY